MRYHGMSLLGLMVTAMMLGFLSPPFAHAAEIGAPGVPTNVTLTPHDGAITVTWQAPQNQGRGPCDTFLAPGYTCTGIANVPMHLQSFRAESSYDPSTKTGYRACSTDGAERSCTITGLANGAQYTVSVKAGNEKWWSDATTAGPVAPCCSAPTAAQNLVARPDSSGLLVSWSSPTDWGGASVLSYRVSTTPQSAGCESTATTCLIPGLERGRNYEVSLTVANAERESPTTKVNVSLPVTPPGAPTNGRVRLTSGTSAIVSWQAPTDTGGKPINTYKAIAAPSGKSCTSVTTHCAILGLAADTKYVYTVTAANVVGRGASSTPIVAGRLLTADTAPSNLKVTLQSDSAKLTWTKPANTGDGKTIEYVTTASPSGRTCRSVKTTCTIRGLQPGATYVFSAQAINTTGAGRIAKSIATLLPIPQVAPPAPKPPATLS